MHKRKAYQAAPLPEVKENTNYFKQKKFWNPSIETTISQCQDIFGRTNISSDMNNCCRCHVLDYFGPETGFPKYSDFYENNTNVINRYKLSKEQGCKTIDQLAVRMAFRTCINGKKDCFGVDGVEKTQEVYAEICATPQCPGILGSICFSYHTDNIDEKGRWIQYALNFDESLDKDYKFSLEALDTKSENQKFRIVRVRFEEGSVINVDEKPQEDEKPCTGASIDIQYSTDTNYFAGEGTTIPASDGTGNWVVDPTGHFAYIIHKATDLPLSYNKETDRLELMDTKPSLNEMEKAIVWYLAQPEQIAIPIPGKNNQRCNMVPGAINKINSTGTLDPRPREDFDSIFHFACIGEISDTDPVYGNCSYNPTGKDGDEILDFSFLGSFSATEYVYLFNTAYVKAQDKPNIFKSQKEADKTFKDSTYWKGTIVDPGYKVEKGDIMIEEPIVISTIDGKNYDYVCNFSYCPKYAFIANTGGKISTNKVSDTIGFPFGTTSVDGDVVWESVDPYKKTVLFSLDYFHGPIFDNPLDNKSYRYEKLNLVSFGGYNGYTENLTPTKSNQQMIFLDSETRDKVKKDLSLIPSLTEYMISDKDKNLEPNTKFYSLQLKTRMYINVGSRVALSSVEDTIKKTRKALGPPEVEDLKLLPFSPFATFAGVPFGSKGISGSNDDTPYNINCTDLIHPSENSYPVMGIPRFYNYYSEFNRVQFVPYGTDSEFKKYTTDDELPNF